MTRSDITSYQHREIDDTYGDASAPSEPHGIDLQYYYCMFLRRWRAMTITIALVFGLGMLYTYTRRPIYESSAKLVVVTSRGSTPTAQNDIPLLNDLQALTRSRSVDTQVEIISSPDLLEDAFNRLSTSTRMLGFKSMGVPGWACCVTAKKDTDIISITARSYAPFAAAQLANTVADTYFERDVQQNNLATHQARQYVERRMSAAESELAQANLKLSEFKARTGLFAPEVQLTKTAEQIAEMSMDLDTSKAEVVSGRREIQALRRELGGETPDVVTGTTVARNPHFDAALERISALNSERVALLQEFVPGSREVRGVDEKIRQEQQRLQRITENLMTSKVQGRNPVRDALLPQYASNVATVAANAARAGALNKVLAKKLQTAEQLPEREREYSELVQHVTLLQRTYDMLSAKYHTLLLSEQATLPNGMLVSKARTPSAPAYPNHRKNAVMYFLLAALLSMVVAIIADWLDSRVHEHSMVEQISGLPTLTQVPSVSHPSQRLLADPDHNGAMLESFRILRNNLSFSNIDRKIKIIAVTSPGSGDGKTTTSVNLAIAMAMEGKRVLLVEGDLRRPSLQGLFEISTNVGLTTVLTGAATLEQAIVKTSVENVYCLGPGPLPPHPAEILNSQQSRDLFRKLAETYDVVVVDCPPCVGLSDVQVISTIADGMLLVVSMNRTLRPHLYMTMRTLAQIKAPLIGLVVNRVEMRRRGYGYYYYHGYYGDYYKHTGDDAQSSTALNSSSRRRHS